MALLHRLGRELSVQVLFIKLRRIPFALAPKWMIISFLILSGPGALQTFSLLMAALSSVSVNSSSKAAMGDFLFFCCFLKRLQRALSNLVFLDDLLIFAKVLLNIFAFLAGFDVRLPFLFNG